MFGRHPALHSFSLTTFNKYCRYCRFRVCRYCRFRVLFSLTTFPSPPPYRISLSPCICLSLLPSLQSLQSLSSTDRERERERGASHSRHDRDRGCAHCRMCSLVVECVIAVMVPENVVHRYSLIRVMIATEVVYTVECVLSLQNVFPS